MKLFLICIVAFSLPLKAMDCTAESTAMLSCDYIEHHDPSQQPHLEHQHGECITELYKEHAPLFQSAAIYSAMQRLDLSHRNLACLACLTELLPQQGDIDLDLEDNELAVLPRSLAQRQITRLNLADNLFEHVPHAVCDLGELLQQLYLTNNEIRYLPPQIKYLCNLHRLDLEGNSLELLPEEIGDLQRLYQLNLADNQISILPESLFRLEHLTILNLSSNKLPELSDEIKNLTQLEELDISDNELTSLPITLTSLGQLTSLTIEDNPELNIEQENIRNPLLPSFLQKFANKVGG